MADISTFGAWVRQQRIQRGLKAVECAARAGVHISVWSRCETGRTRSKNGAPPIPQKETLEAISKGLDIPLAEVSAAAGYADNQHPSELDITLARRLGDYLAQVPMSRRKALEDALLANARTLVTMITNGA